MITPDIKRKLAIDPLLGGFSIGRNAVLTIVDRFFGKTVLELGSGNGSKVLSEYFTLYSIEDNLHFVKSYQGGTVFHVPLKDDWYDVEKLKEVLDKIDYDFLIVDGPYGTQRRMKLYENFHLFKKVPFLIDDTHREIDKKVVELFQKDGLDFEFIYEKDKQSAICYR